MILLDTNVLSEALKPAPAPQVVAWLDARFTDCAISALTVFELAAGVSMMAKGRRRDVLSQAIRRVIQRFAERTYSFDVAAAHAAADLLAKARARGLALHQVPAKLADLQIAGIANAYQLELATRNVADFHGLGIELVDPWTQSPVS